MATIIINGNEKELASTLRVAYKVQGQHSHKSYIEVFQSIGEMPVEQQIGILWAAFSVANPEEAKIMTQVGFQNYCLDNFKIKDLMSMLMDISREMLGSDEDAEDADSETPQMAETEE